MRTGTLAVRYARALLEAALAANCEAAVYERMKAMAVHFVAFPQLEKVLSNPLALRSDKIRLARQAAVLTADHPLPLLERFLDLVMDGKREEMLPSMALQYARLYREKKGIHYGVLTTATPLAADALARLCERFEKLLCGRLELETRVDETLVGGFVLELDMNRMDASVRGQLETIKQEWMTKNTMYDV